MMTMPRISFPTQFRIRARHVRVLATCLLATSTVLACGRGKPGVSTAAAEVVVSNRAIFDVNVFIVRSPLTTARRLGSVTAGLSQTFKVRQSDLQAGGALVLQVRAIAGPATWTSPPLAVGMSSEVNLDVLSTGLGDLSQTRMYVR